MSRRKFSDIWYEHGRNPFPHLLEYWYQEYVREHFQVLGLTNLKGPFKSGADFNGVYKGSSVTVEVEKDYLAYRQHGHKNIDVLIVGVTDPPHPDMNEHLPPIIINIEPQVVMDWSKPFRDEYRAEMEERRAQMPEQLEQVYANLDQVKAFRIKNEKVEFVPKETRACECGGLMMESSHDTELDGDVTEGQFADLQIGFWTIFECKDCGIREWLQFDEVKPQFD